MSMPLALLAMAALAIGTASAAPAATALSPTFSACRDSAQGAIEQAACLSAESTRQDQRLNQAYTQLQARLSGDKRTRLVNAQRAWLQSRSRDSELDTALYDNSQVGNLQGGLDDVLRLSARADQLQKYLQLLD
ncbi:MULTISPECIES: lysozyme inhibitor LprI family protein [unclassified Stenotrophomonas]|uniref:lysozyme inhibitor LprI family protein n=1 Tax=unclassified Stenotrophomonas TaxID=196198 RepID=UPI001F197922|nr:MULTISPECIES: lysozyme inhibitor LprI family protein [unclassified Stenotrophomonas]